MCIALQEYWGHNWQQLYVITTVLMALDLLVCGCTTYSNPLRPVVGILRARNGRRFFEILKKMVPGMSHSLIPLLFFVVLVMAASTMLFDQHIPEYSTSSYASYNWLFLIFTNDNFDRVMPEHMRMNMYYLMFFFPVIYVGQQFLLSLIIGETYETYKSFVKKQLKKERLKQMQGLTKAFTALDVEKNGTISSLVWRECLTQLDPDIPPEAIALYFEIISGGGNTVSVLQFLSLRSVLNFNLRLKGNSKHVMASIQRMLYDPVKDTYKTLRVPVPEVLSSSAKKLLEVVDGWRGWNKINNFDLLTLCLSLSDYPLATLAGSTITPCLIVNFAHLFEYIIRLLACEGKLHDVRKKRTLISNLFVCGVLGRFLCMFLQRFYEIDSSTLLTFSLYQYVQLEVTFPFRKVILLFRALRCCRLASLNKDLRNFTAALLDVMPAVVETFGFTFIVTYIFGTLGNLLFGARLPEWGTPLLAVVKVQQLSLGVDFLDSMEEAMSAVHITSVFFFVCYLILAMAVSNIALSIIIDLQNNVLDSKSSKERDGEAGRMDIVFEKIKSQARARAVVDKTSLKRPLNFGNVVMSPFQSRDVRHFIAADDGDGSDGLNIDDIKQCAKHSNIDLVAYYTHEHKNHKDLHWEVDFIKNVNDCGVKDKKQCKSGEVIFSEGESATVIYLLLDGSVALTSKSHPRQVALMQGTTFFGSECLQPHGCYSYTCAAESSVTLLGISQEAIQEDLGSDVCGDLLRMSFKSNSKIEHAFREARRRSEVRRSRRGTVKLKRSSKLTDASAINSSGSPTSPSASSPASVESTPSSTPSVTPRSTPTMVSALQQPVQHYRASRTPPVATGAGAGASVNGSVNSDGNHTQPFVSGTASAPAGTTSTSADNGDSSTLPDNGARQQSPIETVQAAAQAEELPARPSTFMRVLSDKVQFAPSVLSLDSDDEGQGEGEKKGEEERGEEGEKKGEGEARTDRVRDSLGLSRGPLRSGGGSSSGNGIRASNSNNNSNSKRNRHVLTINGIAAASTEGVVDVVAPIALTPAGPQTPPAFFVEPSVSSNTATQAATITRGIIRTESGKENKVKAAAVGKSAEKVAPSAGAETGAGTATEAAAIRKSTEEGAPSARTGVEADAGAGAGADTGADTGAVASSSSRRSVNTSAEVADSPQETKQTASTPTAPNSVAPGSANSAESSIEISTVPTGAEGPAGARTSPRSSSGARLLARTHSLAASSADSVDSADSKDPTGTGAAGAAGAAGARTPPRSSSEARLLARTHSQMSPRSDSSKGKAAKKTWR